LEAALSALTLVAGVVCDVLGAEGDTSAELVADRFSRELRRLVKDIPPILSSHRRREDAA
jgi:hypothetical protein